MLEEQLEVGVREVETGQVRLHKWTSENLQQLEFSLSREDVEIRRVRVDRIVDQPELPRQVGDVLVVPLHEEVVTTQWLLTEELHIRKRTSTVREPRQVALRREHVHVTRVEAAAEATPKDQDPPADGAGEAAGTAAPNTLR